MIEISRYGISALQGLYARALGLFSTTFTSRPHSTHILEGTHRRLDEDTERTGMPTLAIKICSECEKNLELASHSIQ